MHILVLKVSTEQTIFSVMNKLEKVALGCAKKTGKPLVLVLNNVHLFNNDDNGKNMLLQLQQRAEAWAASGGQFYVTEKTSLSDTSSGRHIDACDELVSINSLPSIYTFVSTFISDDFWPYSVLRKLTLLFAHPDLNLFPRTKRKPYACTVTGSSHPSLALNGY